MLSETDSIAHAARLMTDAGVGFLPICGANHKVIGVVTDRDLVTRGLARGLDPETTSAAMIMTTPALTCLESTDLRSAEDLMGEERKARLVVTNDEGVVMGVLSIADVIERAPRREALHTLKAIMWREALGPRAGARADQPLLRDLPLAPAATDDVDVTAATTVFVGGNHFNGMKEFPT